MTEISTQEARQITEKVTVANFVRAETDHMIRANCIPISPGWNYAIRMYQPRTEILDGS
jgi:hypothetical protein